MGFVAFRFAVGRLVPSVILGLLLAVAWVVPALAAPPVENVQCILGQPNTPTGLNCVSNDIQLSSPVVTVVDGCNFPGDTATLMVLVDVTNNANNRYDVGVWLSVDGDPNGDGAETGICSVVTLDNDLVNADGGLTNIDGDQCGDVHSTDNGPPDIVQADLGTVSLLCEDNDGDGQLDVPLIIAWDNQAGNVCDVSTEAVPNTASKCRRNDEVNLPVPVPARLIVNKDTVPNNATLFSFNLSGPDSGIPGGFDGSHGFQLADNGQFDSGTEFTGGLPAGDNYSVTETPIANYNSVGVCSSDVDDGNTDPDDLDLRPGETVTCDFTNTLTIASLTIRKQSQGGTDSFDFSGSGSIGNFSLDTEVTNPAEMTFQVTAPGSYDITETVPAGWNLNSASCEGDLGTADLEAGSITGIALQPGDDVTCTFVDAALGTITLTKLAFGGDDTFGFMTSFDAPADEFDITTNSGSGTVGGGFSLVPGNYTATEDDIPDGWSFLDFVCLDQDELIVSTPDGGTGINLVVADGATIACTVRNVKLGTIIIEKETDPAGNVADSFTFNNAAGLGGGTFVLMDGGQQTFNDVAVTATGTTEYVISEQDPTPGFDLTDVSCTSNLAQNDSTGDEVTRTATINLKAGETVTCTFTNTERASLTVEKQLSGDPGDLTTEFGFTTNFDAPFSLDPVNSPAEMTFDNLEPGVGFMVAETNPNAQGWALISATCGGIGETVNLTTGMITDIPLQAGADVTCTFINAPLGSATIVKNAVGGDGEFSFIGSQEPFNNGGAGFVIDTSVSNTADFTNLLLPGIEYDLFEQPVPENWTLTDVVCTDPTEDSLPDGSEEPPADPALGALIRANVNETVTCTFTNEADATFTVVKQTVPDSDNATEFEFSGSVNGSITNGNQLQVMAPAGVFTAEELVPDGWALTDISCVGVAQENFTIGETDVSADLLPGESATCTFTNTRLGSITISKTTVGGNGAFSFTGSDVDHDAGIIPDVFALTTPAPDEVTYDGLLPGQYLFAETVPMGWDLDGNIVCSGDTNSSVETNTNGVDIELLDGEDITCVFTNTARGSIRVEKQTDPDGSAQQFGFTGDITDSLADGEFSTAVSVPPGNYSATETAVEGWSVQGISCDDGNSSGAGSTANFVVAAGEHVTCTFSNQIARGTITVVKQTDPDGSQQLFEFDSSWNEANFSLADGQQNASGPLLPSSESGTYSVEEINLPDGWAILSAVCSGAGNTPEAIDLQPGEDVTCTFTNTLLRASIVVDKVTLPGVDPQSFAFTASYGNFNLTDQALPNDSGALVPSSEAGPYSVVETVPDGWELTSATCDNGDDPSAITLEADTIVTCTFVNTKNARIEAELQLIPPLGDTFQFLNALVGQIGDNAVLGKNVTPGAYTAGMNLAAIIAANWNVDSVVCDDDNSIGDDSNALAEYNAEPGETVHCVFTLALNPGLTLLKAVNGGEAQPADFMLTLTGVDGVHNAGVAYASGSTPAVQAGVNYVVSEADGQVEDYFLESLVCVNDADQAPLGTMFVLAAGQTVTCTATNTLNEVLFDIITEVCVRDTPFVDYEVSTTGGVAPSVTITWIKNDGSNEVVEVINDASPAGTLLWPGAAVDMDGNPIDWPGWDLVDGVWVEIDDGLRPTMILQFDINPTAQIVVSYPPATPACDANPPPPPPPGEQLPVPVDNAWALALMTLMMLALGWYFRPVEVRSRRY